MRKKLQVFISSTYKDLKDERQAAVEAILSAGHIPAGMELFSAGNETQLDTVKRWIDDSDVFMLILGGRYGSIEPKTLKSYIQLEYQYAIEKGIPVFAIVISDKALHNKVKRIGSDVIELDNQEKYKDFKNLVLSRICKFYDDTKDIKLAIFETLNDYQNRYQLSGWISVRDFLDYQKSNLSIQFLQRPGRVNRISEAKRIDTDSFPERLTEQEESFYLDLLEQGDEKARYVLMERNLWLVANIAQKYIRDPAFKDDIISIGVIGLIKAITRYKRSLKVSFIKHLSEHIEKELEMFLRNK